MHFFNKAMMGRGQRLVQGSVSSQGSLSVPPGVFGVTFTGRGGEGTSTYNPGQAAVDGYASVMTAFYGYQNYPSTIPYPNYPGSIYNSALTFYAPLININYPYISYDNPSYGSGATYMVQSTGQSYIAPYYTYTTGPSTTSSSAISTSGSLTWNGNYGAGLPSPTNQTMTLNGQGGSISYAAASGTTLAYEYWE